MAACRTQASAMSSVDQRRAARHEGVMDHVFGQVDRPGEQMSEPDHRSTWADVGLFHRFASRSIGGHVTSSSRPLTRGHAPTTPVDNQCCAPPNDARHPLLVALLTPLAEANARRSWRGLGDCPRSRVHCRNVYGLRERERAEPGVVPLGPMRLPERCPRHRGVCEPNVGLQRPASGLAASAARKQLDEPVVVPLVSCPEVVRVERSEPLTDVDDTAVAAARHHPCCGLELGHQLGERSTVDDGND
jgi:hypothetical protein